MDMDFNQRVDSILQTCTAMGIETVQELRVFLEREMRWTEC